MKANEFVKKFGWDEVKRIVTTYTNATHVTDDAMLFVNGDVYRKKYSWFADSLDNMVTITDLKRLVESYELVESVGGWNNATALYDEYLCTNLKQAILDVESCA